MPAVFTAGSPAEAHLVAGFLEEAGIEAFIEGEMLFGARGDLGLSPATLPTVAVRDEDVPRALELIREKEAELRARGAPEDEDALPPPPRWRRASVILVLWILLGAVGTMAMGAIVLPFVALACFVHVYLEVDRAS